MFNVGSASRQHHEQSQAIIGLTKEKLRKCTRKVRTNLYTSMVRPHLEYADVVWDPGQARHINRVESVQRAGVRFIAQDFDWRSSVEVLNRTIGLPLLLSVCRRQHRLITLYDYLSGNLVLNNFPPLIHDFHYGTIQLTPAGRYPERRSVPRGGRHHTV